MTTTTTLQVAVRQYQQAILDGNTEVELVEREAMKRRSAFASMEESGRACEAARHARADARRAAADTLIAVLNAGR